MNIYPQSARDVDIDHLELQNEHPSEKLTVRLKISFTVRYLLLEDSPVDLFFFGGIFWLEKPQPSVVTLWDAPSTYIHECCDLAMVVTVMANGAGYFRQVAPYVSPASLQEKVLETWTEHDQHTSVGDISQSGSTTTQDVLQGLAKQDPPIFRDLSAVQTLCDQGCKFQHGSQPFVSFQAQRSDCGLVQLVYEHANGAGWILTFGSHVGHISTPFLAQAVRAALILFVLGVSHDRLSQASAVGPSGCPDVADSPPHYSGTFLCVDPESCSSSSLL